MYNYTYYKNEAKTRLGAALAMLEQYTFREGLEWGKDGINPIEGNTRTKQLKKCEDIIRKYINEKWGR